MSDHTITVVWVIKTFLYSSSVYYCHLFLILLLLLGTHHFCILLSLPLHKSFPLFLQFSFTDLQSFPFCCFPLFLCIVHRRRSSYVSLLFSGTLHSLRQIFSFLLCLTLLFFSQLFVKPPQTTTFHVYISFSCIETWNLRSTNQCKLDTVKKGTIILNMTS